MRTAWNGPSSPLPPAPRRAIPALLAVHPAASFPYSVARRIAVPEAVDPDEPDTGPVPIAVNPDRPDRRARGNDDPARRWRGIG